MLSIFLKHVVIVESGDLAKPLERTVVMKLMVVMELKSIDNDEADS